ncbi:uncharacterized protein J3R85_000245 [Psidium guajava]|nr:uncharacterized protein J3R85_000245 [Psidium guajava]
MGTSFAAASGAFLGAMSSAILAVLISLFSALALGSCSPSEFATFCWLTSAMCTHSPSPSSLFSTRKAWYSLMISHGECSPLPFLLLLLSTVLQQHLQQVISQPLECSALSLYLLLTSLHISSCSSLRVLGSIHLRII